MDQPTQNTTSPNQSGNSASSIQSTIQNPQDIPVDQLHPQNLSRDPQANWSQAQTEIALPAGNTTFTPAPAPSTSAGMGWWWALLAAIVVLAFAHFIRRRGQVKILPDQATDRHERELKATKPKTNKKAAKPKAKPTKKQAKRKNRKHR